MMNNVLDNHRQELLWTVFIFEVHIKHMYIPKFLKFSLILRVRKEFRAKLFGWFDIGYISLRGKHAGVTVLHMQLWAHEFSFNIDLWLVNHGTESLNFLVEKYYFSLICLNQSSSDTQARFSEKVRWKSVDLTQAVIFIPQKIILNWNL